MRLSPSGRRVKLQVGHVHGVIDLDDCGLISAAITVVWRRKQSYHIFFVGLLITLHYQLMGAVNVFYAVHVQVFFRYVLTEGVTRSPWRYVETNAVIGIAPQ